MYVPSIQVRQRMQIERSGLWIERRRQDVCLLLKSPTILLKSLHKYSLAKLLIGDIPTERGHVRCLALQIEDVPHQPCSAIHACRTRSEQKSLQTLLSLPKLPLHLFDELERSVASCSIELGQTERERALVEFEIHRALYAGRFTRFVKDALDRFCDSLDSENTALTEIPLRCESWQLINITGIGSGSFRLDEDEGSGLEQSAHQLVESLFAEHAHRSPEVDDGDTGRELTDSLLIFDDAICLMEMKALSMYQRPKLMSASRRVSNVTKDIKKGVRQLKGAVRKIRNGSQIYTNRHKVKGMYSDRGRRIDIPDREIVVLGLVLLSDIECDLDWDWATQFLLSESTEKTLFQVLDLAELRSLVGTANSPLQFFTNVIVRFQQVKQIGSGLLRFRLWRK